MRNVCVLHTMPHTELWVGSRVRLFSRKVTTLLEEGQRIHAQRKREGRENN